MEPIAHPRAVSSALDRASLLVLAGLFALAVYRAQHQAMAHDEVWTWTGFASGGPARIFGEYAPNNHVLHSLLVWLSAAAFGPREWSLRLPALAGYALLLAGTGRLVGRIFRCPFARIAAILALAGNPLVLDYGVQARGYGLAAAFLLQALLDLSAEDPEGRSGFRAGRASLACGLAVATIPSSVFAAAALLLASLRPARARGESLAPALLRRTVPAGLACGLLLGPILGKVRQSTLHFGSASLGDCLNGLGRATFWHHPTPWPAADRFLLALPLPMALTAAALVLATSFVPKNPSARPSPAAALLRLLGPALALQLGFLAVAHRVLALPWPRERTALDLLLLADVTLLAAIARLGDRALPSLLRRLGIAFLTVWALVSVLRLQVDRFASHPYDRHAREVVRVLASLAAERPGEGPATVFLDPRLARSIRLHADWMGVRRLVFEDARGDGIPRKTYDFYVGDETTRQLLAAGGVTEAVIDRSFRRLATFGDPLVEVLGPR